MFYTLIKMNNNVIIPAEHVVALQERYKKECMRHG